MKKKAIKYIIFLLLIPLAISLTIAIATDNKGFNQTSTTNSYNAMDVPDYSNDIIINEVNYNVTHVYFSVFALIIVFFGIYFYVKNKKGF